jgi:competence protein CoiA
MQWTAIDENGVLINVLQAAKHKRYSCLECARAVQLRSGPHRQAHFFHIDVCPTCTQHKKSEEHLQLQCDLKARIGQASMERRFPEINRIADVAWESRKIVFEIQCSPISWEEAHRRCEDYRSLGWEILWILSDKRFNKRRLSAAEQFLRGQTSYFSSRGKLYDQWEIIRGFCRVHRGQRTWIDPTQLERHTPTRTLGHTLPRCIQSRFDSWRLRAQGDVLSQAMEKPSWLKDVWSLEVPKEQESRWSLLKKGYKSILLKILSDL